MKLTSLLICLLALTCSAAASSDLEYSYDNDEFRCFQDVYADGNNLGVTWTIQVIAGGESRVNTQTVTNSEEQQTNLISIDISSLPCGATMVCRSNLDANGNPGVGISTSIVKDTLDCRTPDTIPGTTIGTGNQSLPGVNYGTIPYNLTGNITGTKILGLSKNIFFTLAGLLILTMIATTIRNLRLGLVSIFLGLLFMVDVLKIISIPITLLGLILIVVVAYVVKGVKL